MAPEEKKQSKRKGRQPEQMGKGDGYIPWVPRKEKWRTHKSIGEIMQDRRIQKHFEREGVTTQARISAEKHFGRASDRLGEDEEKPGVWRYHDAIHKLITLSGAEDEIDHHPLFRRLMHVKQTEAILSGYYVAASHDRHAHSLGAMHMAGRIAKALKLPAKTVAELRFAALVHDIGHTTFSHGAEAILKRKLGMNHEQLGEKRMRKTQIPKMLARHGLDFEQVMKYKKGKGLGEIVTEYADRMDYLQRDGFHVGVKTHVQRDVKLTVEEIIRNLRLEGGKVCVTPEGETALKKFADLRTTFFSQIYFYPPSMLTRHFLRKALEIGAKRRVIRVKDLLEGSDEEILRKLADARIPEADQIHLRNTYLRFNPVFAAHFGQLTPHGSKQVENNRAVRKIQRALETAGLKQHEYYVDVTPNVAKPITYRVLRPDGRMESKTYAPEMPKDERLLFVYALRDKEEQVRKAIERHVEPLTHKPHIELDLQSGNEKI